ncbi:MAG: DcaP family trimeric outer membrane transporter [Planctomycetota bacterium]
MKRLVVFLSCWLAVGATVSGVASAQTVEELSKRIEVLEAREASAAAGTTVPDFLTKMGSMLKIYGFLRVDGVYDTSELSDTQVGVFVRSEDPTTGQSQDDDDFSLYTRLTRLGLDLVGPNVGKAQLTGKVEVDFYGFLNSDSRNDLRMRHAYLKIGTDNCSLLAGQTSDLISPLFPSVNPDLINWNIGNLGDRRPQVRLGYHPKINDSTRVIFEIAASLKGAIDGGNFDADGVLDGEDSGLPLLQGRAALRTRLLGSTDTEVGVWVARGWDEFDLAAAQAAGTVGAGVTTDEFDTYVFGIDARVPLVSDSVWLQGEAWRGSNLDDLRGGVGQGVNATAGDEIEAMGFWAELNVKPKPWLTTFAGYSVDNPDRTDLLVATVARPNQGIDHNQMVYCGANVSYWKPVVFGCDYSYIETRFRGLDEGFGSRFRLFIQYNF